MTYQILIDKIENKGYKVILEEHSTRIVEPLKSLVTGKIENKEVGFSTVFNDIGREQYLNHFINLFNL